MAVALAGIDDRITRVSALVATPDWARPGVHTWRNPAADRPGGSGPLRPVVLRPPRSHHPSRGVRATCRNQLPLRQRGPPRPLRRCQVFSLRPRRTRSLGRRPRSSDDVPGSVAPGWRTRRLLYNDALEWLATTPGGPMSPSRVALQRQNLDDVGPGVASVVTQKSEIKLC